MMRRLVTTVVALLFAASAYAAQVANPLTRDAANAVQPGTSNNLGIWYKFPGVADATTGAITATGGSAAFSGLTTTAADIGKLIYVPGIGANGGLFSSTIASVGNFAAAPTFSTGTWWGFGEVCPVGTAQSGAGSYAAGDTITLATANANVSSVCTVKTTGVVSATINAAGTGGTNGTCVVLGTTGTALGSVRFAAEVVISGGAISSTTAVRWPGSYTTNPTSLVAEPVTGCSLVGATLTIKMGVRLALLTTRGNYTAQPSSSAAQTSTSGSGTGFISTMTYLQAGATTTFNPLSQNAGTIAGVGSSTLSTTVSGVTYGTDNRALLQTAMALAPTNSVLHIAKGTYLVSVPPSAHYWDAGSNVSLVGDGKGSTTILFPPGGSIPWNGDGLFRWNNKSGFSIRDLTVDLNNSINSTGDPMSAGPMVVVFWFPGTTSDVSIERAAVLNNSALFSDIDSFPTGSSNSLSRLSVRESRFTFTSVYGTEQHCIHPNHGASGTVTALTIKDNVCVGANIAINADNYTVDNNEVSGWGWGPAIAPGFSATTRGSKATITHNRLHDPAIAADMSASSNDIHGGVEGYAVDSVIDGNQISTTAGPGIYWCGQHATISHNLLAGNGTGLPANRSNNQPAFAAGILLGSVAADACDPNYSTVTGNTAYDTATVVGSGTVTQQYGLQDFVAGGVTLAGITISGNNFQNNGTGNALLSSAGIGEIVDSLSASGISSRQIFYQVSGSIAQSTTACFSGVGSINAANCSTIAAKMPAAGIMRNLNVLVVNTPTAATFAFTLDIGATLGAIADSALTCSISNGQTSCSDTTHSIAIPAGSFWNTKLVTGATTVGTGQLIISYEWDSTQ